MESPVFILAIGFFFIALIYSSVGFGGGSSYLALLGQSFFLFNQADIKTTALLCNIVVVTGGAILFYKNNHVDFKRCWPFLAASVPFAFLGGLWRISDSLFFIILGVSLVIASLMLWIRPKEILKKRSDNLLLNSSLGSGIGFLSGLVGIGGGIFLSPVLHLIHWDDAKKISGLASLFILVNSISGLAGQLVKTPQIDWAFSLPLLLAVFFGGQIGSRLGAKKFNPLHIKRITAVLILAAGINILRDHL